MTGHTEEHEYDPYKDSLIRFFGYANEVGEAFRPLIPRWLVNATYGVAIVYALGDTYDKVTKAYVVRNKHSGISWYFLTKTHLSQANANLPQSLRNKRAADAALYTLTWQTAVAYLDHISTLTSNMIGTKLPKYIRLV